METKMKWFKYIKPYLPYFILGPICMIVEVIGEVLMPKFLSLIIDYGVNKTDIASAPKIIQWIYSHTDASGYIVAIMASMIITAILMMIGGVGGAFFGAKASVNFAADLRSDVYAKIQTYSFSNIDKYSAGSLVTRLTNDVTQMQNFINMLLRMALRAPGMMIGALIMAFLLNPRLTLVLAVTMPLLLIFLGILVSKGFPLFGKMQTKIDALNSTVQESVTNVRVVKSFVREDTEKQKFGTANDNLKKAGLAAMGVMVFISPVMNFFMNVTTIAVLWFGGDMVMRSTMSTGDLIAFVTYITQILSSLMMVTMMFIMFSRALASARRIKEVMEEKPDVSDEGLTAEQEKMCVKNGEVEFRNVTFRYYKNSPDAVLKNVNLKIPAGYTVGIIGSTGCGKTTLVSLLPRLYDADEGEVLIDGVPVKEYSLHNLREGVGMVLQKNVLFSGSIEENLRWGDQNASDEQIREAAQRAQADKFVSEFKEGYKTDLGQGGSNVSGGQKQRLCIARALLKKPKILILDDSTSAVDTATEAQIRAAFKNELSDSTKIIIAQRISSVKDADMIVVMDDGEITGVGTHDELMKNNEEYSEIYYSQHERKEA